MAVSVLIEVPVMLMLVAICRRYCYIFKECKLGLRQCAQAAFGTEEQVYRNDLPHRCSHSRYVQMPVALPDVLDMADQRTR